MRLKPDHGSSVYLDACCLINLLATHRIEQILQALPFRFAVSQHIADHEILPDFGGMTTSGFRRLKMNQLGISDLLDIQNLATDEELTEFVRFATVLDDGEASVCALALVHGGAVATDDRKALRKLRQWAPSTPTLQTSELLYEWALIRGPSRSEVSRVLSAIRDQARFVPGTQAPYYKWWREHLE